MDTHVIQTENLTKSYGTRIAVNHLNLTVEAKQIHGFLGPNGAGKTTTIRMLVGLLRPDAGRVVVCGADVARDPLRAKAHIGFVPDEPGVYGKLTLPEFLLFSASLYGRRDPETPRRA